ncbi:MAG: hypothetical protein ACYC97_13945 [Metallibacterium sp.]
MKTKLIAFLALGAFVTGCSGQAIPPAPKLMAPMTFRVVVPASISAQSVARQGVTPQYISASTNSVMFVLTSYNGASQSPPPTTTVALTGSNCTGTPKVCTVSSSEPVGNDSFTVATYYTTTPTWGTDVPLSENSVNYTVASGANSISVTLNGVVNSLAFSPMSANCPSATSSCTVAAAINAFDRQGDTIIGPGVYDTLTGAADTIALSCATGLALQTATGGNAFSGSGQTTAPSNNDLAQVVYDGTGGTSGGSLTCTASDAQSPALSATFTVNLAAVGSVSWTLQ